MTAIHAARVAASIRERLGLDVARVHGRYGEFRVLVDGEPVVKSRALGFLGVLPSEEEVLAAVKAKLR